VTTSKGVALLCNWQEEPKKTNNEMDRKHKEQESPANAKGTRDSSACMKAHCEQM